MIIECGLEKIKNAVAMAETVSGKNLSLPVLANIIFEIKDRLLKIKATNLDLGLEIILPCKIDGGGEATAALNGALLGSFFNNLSPATDKIKIELKDGNFVVSSARQSTTIKGLPVDDFPIIPPPDAADSFFIASGELMSGLRAVWTSASISSMKPEISSVCFARPAGNLVLAATDSFRLAEKLLSSGKGENTTGNLMVPLKNIVKIMKIIDAGDMELEVKYNPHQISFLAENFYLTSRLIDGVYPDYRQIIPARWETEITVSRPELLNLLKLANVFTDKFSQVDLTAGPDKLEVKTINEGGQNVAWLKPLAASGEPVAASLNLKYLLDGLQVINRDQVVLKFNGGHKPMMLAGAGDASYTYLIMPIRRWFCDII